MTSGSSWCGWLRARRPRSSGHPGRRDEGPKIRPLGFSLVALLIAGAAGTASEIGLSGAEGHPRSRFPLALYVKPLPDASLHAAVSRAVSDWNVVFEQALGLQVFTGVGREAEAQVVLTFDPPTSPKSMGETALRADPDGVIVLPVRIVVFEPAARGRTAPETVLYQVVAHELGHALGLEHVTDPRSLMCCRAGSIDFNDPAVREAYIEARRHPDVSSVRPQLEAHYAAFWRKRR